jgi:two-component system OmpR family response regulator
LQREGLQVAGLGKTNSPQRETGQEQRETNQEKSETDEDASSRNRGNSSPYEETPRTNCIIVADADEAIRRTVVTYFEESNVLVNCASNREELIIQLRTVRPNLIILNRKLGKWDGLDLLRDIRSRSNVPVVLVAERNPDEIDRVVGLELGADDYIAKPFSVRELLARTRAILRRQEAGRVEKNHDREQGGYRFGGWRLEQRSRTVVDSSGAPVPLRKSEYALLLAFLQAPQRVLTREQLLRATRLHEDISDRSIDVQVMRLRRKFASDPQACRAIQTNRGIGYTFTLAVVPY